MKSALTYPIVVLVIAFVAMIVMSVFVLPKFTGLYASLGAKLPLPTRMLIGFTNFMTELLAIGARRDRAGRSSSLFVAIGGQTWQEPPRHLAMKLAGDRKSVPAHLARAVLPGALVALVGRRAAANRDRAVGRQHEQHPLSRRTWSTVREALVRGGGLYEPMAETGLFPIAARQMIQVGERTGMLGNQLGKAASYYEREVKFTMKRATELFQPAVILLVAARRRFHRRRPGRSDVQHLWPGQMRRTLVINPEEQHTCREIRGTITNKRNNEHSQLKYPGPDRR